MREPGTIVPLDPALRGFADALLDPCLLIDGGGRLLHANPAAIRELPALAVGEPIAFSIRHPGLIGAVEAARASGGPATAQMQQSTPTLAWHNVTVAPIAGGSTFVVTLRNVTAERRVEAMRVDFVANVSHELRTPLASVIGFIDTLLGPAAEDAEARRKFLGLMRAQAGRMSRLIDDLLSLSRIELRQHQRPEGRVDLRLLLREVVEGLQTQARDAGLEVRLSLAETEAEVPGDRGELYEVFENLLDNALKYGEGGGHVELALDPAAEPGLAWKVTVIDHGPGVDSVEVPRLTERFYRAAGAVPAKRGTGLGLAIVKHIVSRHRGRLSIRSAPGEGMRVEVLLPG